MATKSGSGQTNADELSRAVKRWGVVLTEVLTVGGSFLIGWAPPGNAGGISSLATGLAASAALVPLLALFGVWPTRPSAVLKSKLRLGLAALAVVTIGLTIVYSRLLGDLVYVWPESGGTAATASSQRYVRGDVLTALGREDLEVNGLSASAAVARAGGQPLVDEEALLWTTASRQSAGLCLTAWYVATVCAWSTLIIGLLLLGGKRLTGGATPLGPVNAN